MTYLHPKRFVRLIYASLNNVLFLSSDIWLDRKITILKGIVIKGNPFVGACGVVTKPIKGSGYIPCG